MLVDRDDLRLNAVVRLRVIPGEPHRDEVELRTRLRQRDPIGQAADDAQAPDVAGLAREPGHGRKGLPHIGDAGKPEVAAGDANDDRRNAVDGDRAAKDRSIAGVARLPQAVAKDHYSLRAGLIVVGTEIAPEHRRFAEQAEEIV